MTGVMFNFVGACLASALIFGGGLFQAGSAGAGLGLMAVGAIGMGLLLALALTVSADEADQGLETTAKSALTFDDINDWMFDALEKRNSDYWDMPVYLLDDGINPACGVFLARINGERAIVIERAEAVDDTIEVLRPVFSDREGM